MATTTFTKLVTSGVCQEVHECDWVIKNWELVQVDENLVNDQRFEIMTGNRASLLAKFTIGMEVLADDGDGNRFVGVYCKLEELTGGGGKLEIPVSFGVKVDNPNGGSFWEPAPVAKSIKVQETCTHGNGFNFGKSPDPQLANYLVEGTLTIHVRLRVLNPMSVPQSVTSSMSEFEKKSIILVQADYGNLLKDDSPIKADLTIISKDKRRLPCHKLILSARNPVFAKMLETELSEKETNVINMDDLSGKTVEVLLHYLYTGKLLDTWSHPDVIVELTYASGKYQLKEVLQMLDNLLGSSNGKTTGTSLLLLELANKLSLKKAEAELMERIVKFTMSAGNSAALMALMENENPGESDGTLVLPVIKLATSRKRIPAMQTNKEKESLSKPYKVFQMLSMLQLPQ